MSYSEQEAVMVELAVRVKNAEKLLSKITHDYDNLLEEMGKPPASYFGEIVEHFKKYNPSILAPTDN